MKCKRIITVLVVLLSSLITAMSVSADTTDKQNKGWVTINGSKYYFLEDGSAVTQNITINGIRYKFDSDGVCKGKFSGFVKKSGYKYYYRSGKLVKGWFERNGEKYYSDEKKGRMYIDTNLIDNGYVYCFDKNGKWDGKKQTYRDYKISQRKSNFGELIADINTDDYTMQYKIRDKLKWKDVDKADFSDFLKLIRKYKNDRLYYVSADNDCELPDLYGVIKSSGNEYLVRFSENNKKDSYLFIIVSAYNTYNNGDTINSWCIKSETDDVYEFLLNLS